MRVFGLRVASSRLLYTGLGGTALVSEKGVVETGGLEIGDEIPEGGGLVIVAD